MKQVWVMALFVGVMTTGCARRGDAVEVRPDDLLGVTLRDEDVAVVQYIRVGDQACLPPKVIAGHPDDADLVRAQHQWLARTYPGYRLIRQSHVLTLAPEFRPPGHEGYEDHVERDSIEFETAEGVPISESFALKAPPSGGDDK